MVAKQLPGLVLYGEWDLGEDGWKDGMDSNLLKLSCFVQCAVASRTTELPASPEDGITLYIVPADDVTNGNKLALPRGEDWEYIAPLPGFIAFVVDEGRHVVFDGSAWIPFIPTEFHNLAKLGVGTYADNTNVFAAKLNDALWAAKGTGEGGTGDLRYKLNKESSGNTVSLLFQSNWSGRAEIGLAGDDDFRFKVSPDGSSWYEAITIDRNSGRVRLPSTPMREVLSGDRWYNVDPVNGDDNNDGFTPATAFKTIQKAVNTALNLDPNGYTVTIQLADGVYNEAVRINRPMFDGGMLVLMGNWATPQNVVINAVGGNALLVDGTGARVRVEGIKFSGDIGIWARFGGMVFLTNKNAFGACAFRQIAADNNGFIEMLGGEIWIEGDSPHHLYADANGHIYYSHGTTHIVGNPNFIYGFAYAQATGLITSINMYFDGSATGPRYQGTMNGVINVNLAGPDYFPGDQPGALSSGAQYV